MLHLTRSVLSVLATRLVDNIRESCGQPYKGVAYTNLVSIELRIANISTKACKHSATLQRIMAVNDPTTGLHAAIHHVKSSSLRCISLLLLH